MAVPPSYSDLGKAAKDIFSKGYGKYAGNYGQICIYYQCLSVSTDLQYGMAGLLDTTLWNTFSATVFNLAGFGIVKLDLKTKSQNGVVSGHNTHVSSLSISYSICSISPFSLLITLLLLSRLLSLLTWFMSHSPDLTCLLLVNDLFCVFALPRP